MPQMREVISGASLWRRPLSSASKNLGGSKMLSATSPTSPSRTSTYSSPSPSTRARPSTWKLRLVVSWVMREALFPEGWGIGVERPEQARDVHRLEAPGEQPAGERGGV